MKKIIHVNQHVIRDNRTTGSRKPVLTVKGYRSNEYAHEVEIKGPCRIVYRPDVPLSCGARVWIETTSEVVLQTTPSGSLETEEGSLVEAA
jgi:hypothetical protein